MTHRLSLSVSHVARLFGASVSPQFQVPSSLYVTLSSRPVYPDLWSFLYLILLCALCNF